MSSTSESAKWIASQQNLTESLTQIPASSVISKMLSFTTTGTSSILFIPILPVSRPVAGW